MKDNIGKYMIRKCSDCGAPVPNSNFCIYCGNARNSEEPLLTYQRISCPHCGYLTPDDGLYCGVCGEKTKHNIED